MGEDRRTTTRPRRVRAIVGGVIGALLVGLGLWWVSEPSGRPGVEPARQRTAAAGVAERGRPLDAPPTREAGEEPRVEVAGEAAATDEAPAPRGDDGTTGGRRAVWEGAIAHEEPAELSMTLRRIVRAGEFGPAVEATAQAAQEGARWRISGLVPGDWVALIGQRFVVQVALGPGTTSTSHAWPDEDRPLRILFRREGSGTEVPARAIGVAMESTVWPVRDPALRIQELFGNDDIRQLERTSTRESPEGGPSYPTEIEEAVHSGRVHVIAFSDEMETADTAAPAGALSVTVEFQEPARVRFVFDPAPERVSIGGSGIELHRGGELLETAGWGKHRGGAVEIRLTEAWTSVAGWDVRLPDGWKAARPALVGSAVAAGETLEIRLVPAD